MNKILLITYYWPPCGGVSVQRWLKFSKYLLQKGCISTIVTTHDGDYPYVDESLVDTIPSEIKVLSTYTPTFKKLFKLLVGKNEKLPFGSLNTYKSDSFFKKVLYFLRSQLVYPDARVVWNKYAFKTASKELKSGDYTAVITTGPPHSTHLVGLKLKNKYNIKWIADFRDPWTQIYYYQESGRRNPFINYLDKNLERKVLVKADATVTISHGISDCFEERVNYTIHNGFDHDDYLNKTYTKNEKFRIKFVGALTDSRKDEVISTLAWISDIAQKSNSKDIEFTLIGSYIDYSNDFEQLFPFISFKNTGFINHSSVIQECVDSEILLLVINNTPNNLGILTYKIFEYIGSRTYILGVGPEGCDANVILKEITAGELFDYGAKKSFLNSFNELYKKWQNGECLKNKNVIDKYSVLKLSEKYIELFNSDSKNKVGT